MMMHRVSFVTGRLRSRVIMRSIVVNPQGNIPYGLSDWNRMRQDQFVYVDRTKAIAQLDADTYHSSLWEPRRTGKSLLVNQLALWHDKAIPEKERMELFAGTYIGQNPSAMAGKYLVLAMDFSDVDEKDVHRSFTDSVNASIDRFSKKYRKAGLLDEAVTINDKNFASSLSNMASAVRLSGHKVSLIVDEADSFSNRLFLQVSHEKGLGDAGYNAFLQRGVSTLRHFGRVVKAESSNCIERMFFTGVLPVAWSTDSLNTVKNLTDDPAFHQTLGFKSSDIDELLALRFPAMDPDERAKHLAAIHRTCNGYRRSSSQVKALYNPQAVWFYLKQLESHGDRMVPHIDPNVLPPVPDEVVAFLVRHAAAAYSHGLMDEAIPYEPLHGFSTADLFDGWRQPQALLSLAHYLGYLTVQCPKDEARGDVLVAPNEEMRSVFTESVLRSLPELYQTWAFAAMAKNVPEAVAVKEAFDAYVTGIPPKQ